MRLFFDTCTIIDFLCGRQHANLVDEILMAAEENGWECYISVGSFYTLTYLIELHLKRNGYSDKDQRIEKLREMLANVLSAFSIADIFSEDLIESVNNHGFTDLEDSYQFKAAVKAGCNYLITININDFKGADTTSVKIVTPADFLTLAK